jgi:hypothetical protein
MADVKISGLPASTVPLAGTEVLPIVQGGATKQVSIANVTAGRDVSALSITTPTYKAANSAGGALQNASGVNQLQWGAGGGSNLSVDVAITINPANAAVAISPTGTGTVAISPAGALTVNPTAASTMNNVAIGGTTPLAGSFTDLSFNSGYGSVVTAYGCRAWVNFNGTGTPAIRGSGNVTSITDAGVGQYRVNLTTAMPDRNYSAVASAGYYVGATDSTYCNIDQFGNLSTSIVPITCKVDGGTYYDPDLVCCAVFR